MLHMLGTNHVDPCWQGVHTTAVLYGQYAEKYVHTETFLRHQDKTQLSEGCGQLQNIGLS